MQGNSDVPSASTFEAQAIVGSGGPPGKIHKIGLSGPIESKGNVGECNDITIDS